jgi:hemerythrin-like domain-containing protein
LIPVKDLAAPADYALPRAGTTPDEEAPVTPRPTEILSAEHRVIEQVLAVLEKMSDRARTEGEVCLSSARDAIAFLRTFADKCHHGKEEARLFPAMERHGLPADAGPTAVMRAEHEMGREAVRRMDEAVVAHAKGDASAASRFAYHAHGFVELLREHIAKEDQVLFPMADRMLPPAVQTELLADFETAEREEMGEGTHEAMLEVAERLCAKWGVTAGDALAKAHACGCAHAGAAKTTAAALGDAPR